MTSTSTRQPDTEWGPTIRGGRGRRRRWIVVAVAVVVLLPVVYGLALALRLSGAIDRVPVTTLSGGGGPIHVLVIGSDSREGLTEQEMLELGTGAVAGERTDTIFVLTVEGGRAGILAFPRDLYVTRCDGSSGRINAALGIGGVDCLVDTVESLSGIPLDHYMAVSFGGFVDIVDAVGGVEICVEKPLHDPFAGISLDPGCQVLNGTQALGFVRTRKLDNDLQRIKRQQKFLGALASEVMTPSTLLNPVTAFDLTGAIGRALTADDGLGVLDLLRLGLGARSLAGGTAVTATVPGTPANIGGAAVLEVDEEAAQPLFAGFRDGSILDQATGATPASTRVRVLNATDVAGLAGATGDQLAERGYEVVGVGNAPAREATVIRYPPDQRANAELLARELPVGAALEESGEVDVVTLVLGADLAGGL